MPHLQKGNSMYLIVVVIALIASYVLAGGFRSYRIHLEKPQGKQVAVGPQRSLAGGTQHNTHTQQINTFAFMTITPPIVPQGGQSGEYFVITNGTVAVDQADFTAQQQDYITRFGFVRSSVTIAGASATSITGTAPVAEISGQRVQGPAQITLIYIPHGTKLTRIRYTYFEARKDPVKEGILTAMLATVQLK